MSGSSAEALKEESASYPSSRPFVKWVGGKSQLLPELVKRIPENFTTYYEPFLGGGALFFALRPSHAVLSDDNEELINAFGVVQQDVDHLIKELKKHRYEQEYFYSVRDADRHPSFKRWSPVRRASRLIFLNKTCYNGLYRVNALGQFNTPFGRYTNPTIVDESNLRACHAALQGASLQCLSFTDIEKTITPNDFVYFDPPYIPLSATASFTGYSSDGFKESMQRELAALCGRLNSKGVRFMLSNSSAPLVSDLYKNFKIEHVAAARSINSKGNRRGSVNEVIVTNY